MATHSVISLDAMSGDLGAEVVVRAASRALRKHAALELVIVGDQEELQGHVTRIVGADPRLTIAHASEVVGMSDSPVDAMRRKKDSSMRVAINL
ncbi:MAG: phosphate acyltransferase, partial [Gammaproteobacteria bacterium]|nr:phosphate acyltransferase [Gammaproteobacteria bacterium]